MVYDYPNLADGNGRTSVLLPPHDHDHSSFPVIVNMTYSSTRPAVAASNVVPLVTNTAYVSHSGNQSQDDDEVANDVHVYDEPRLE